MIVCWPLPSHLPLKVRTYIRSAYTIDSNFKVVLHKIVLNRIDLHNSNMSFRGLKIQCYIYLIVYLIRVRQSKVIMVALVFFFFSLNEKEKYA